MQLNFRLRVGSKVAMGQQVLTEGCMCIVLCCNRFGHDFYVKSGMLFNMLLSVADGAGQNHS